MTIKYSDRMISVLIDNTNSKQELQELLDKVQTYCHPILRGVIKQKIKHLNNQ
jgi:hypothetical protein